MAGRTAAAAGCWPSKECSAPSPSGVLFCRLFLTFAERQNRHGNKWLDTHRLPPGWPAGPAGAAQEENQLLRWNASAVGLHHATFARRRPCRRGRPVPSSRPYAAAQAGHSDPESHRDDERWTFALFRGKSDGPQPARPTPGGSAGRRRCRPRKDPAPRSASPPSRRSSQPASCLTPGRPPAATQVKELRARRAARGKGRARHRRDRARGPSWLTLTILTPATGRSRMSV